jgi:hypothetical protein
LRSAACIFVSFACCVSTLAEETAFDSDEISLIAKSAGTLATTFPPNGFASETFGVSKPSSSADNAVANTVVFLKGLTPYSADSATLS